METPEIQPWFFRVEPFEGESISHFLGRFRRANELTPSGLGKISDLGGTIARWEKFRLNPRPTSVQLEKLCVVTAIPVERLWEMLPSDSVSVKLEPICLCAACYAETPCHQLRWQFKETQCCDRHRMMLLSECPVCKARFKIPSLWNEGVCHRCFTSLEELKKFQKPWTSEEVP